MEKSFEEKLNEEIKYSKNSWNNKMNGSYKMTDSEIRGIFTTVHEVNLQRDEKGMLIPGTGRIITNEEKKQVFDYILENNYPVTRKIYNIVLQAYLSKEIELNINNSIQKL